MPARRTPLVTGQFYHIFNRGINKQPIFLDKRDYKRALETLRFYALSFPQIRFSRFLLLSRERRAEFWQKWPKEKKRVEFVCFAFMPNHFHLLLRQTTENGISRLMSDFQNSYTRYFNTKHKRVGPLFQGQFKAVRVEDENQLLHLSRYLHLNPYSSFVVQKFSDLEEYPWTSLPEYLGRAKTEICSKDVVLSYFKDKKAYRQFVFDQADYQRELERIKHLLLDE